MNASAAPRFGLYMPPFGPFAEADALVRVATHAEAAGWDGVFLWDHVLADGFAVADPWVALGAMASATERVLLGPLVTPLARRRPWVVARQAATLDEISDARAVLGVGVGWPGPDFTAFEEPDTLRLRAEMLDEAVELMGRIWAGGPVAHSGRHYSVAIETDEPAARRPVPIWGAHILGMPRSLERAARLDGICPIEAEGAGPISPSDVAALVAGLRNAKDGFEVVLRGGASKAWPEPAHAPLRELTDAGMTWWLESLIHFDPLELTMKVVDAGPPSP